MPTLSELAPPDNMDAPARYFEMMGFATLLKRLLAKHDDPVNRKIIAKPEKPKNRQSSLF
jgi:hypothetical protein